MEIQRLSGLTRTQFNLLSLPDAVKLMPWNVQKLIQDEIQRKKDEKNAFIQFLIEFMEDELVYGNLHGSSICDEIAEAFDEDAAGMCLGDWICHSVPAGVSLTRLLKQSDDKIATKVIQDVHRDWECRWGGFPEVGRLEGHPDKVSLPDFYETPVWKNWNALMTEHRLEVLKLVVEMEIKSKERSLGWRRAVDALRARFPPTTLLEYWFNADNLDPAWQQARPISKRQYYLPAHDEAGCPGRAQQTPREQEEMQYAWRGVPPHFL
jgi:hypothetical protein